MSYREKESLVNIFSGLVITLIYSYVVYQKHAAGLFDLSTDYAKWGKLMLIYMGVSIVARIVIYIVFHMLNYIATREEDEPVVDERDKLIGLKATRNAYYTFSGGFAMVFIALALGLPVYWVFVAFVGFGVIAEIVENVTQIYLYRKGF